RVRGRPGVSEAVAPGELDARLPGECSQTLGARFPYAGPCRPGCGGGIMSALSGDAAAERPRNVAYARVWTAQRVPVLPADLADALYGRGFMPGFTDP